MEKYLKLCEENTGRDVRILLPSQTQLDHILVIIALVINNLF